MIYTEYTTLWQLDSSFKTYGDPDLFLLFPFFIFENMLLH